MNGVSVSKITIDINGLVYLHSTENWRSVYSLSYVLDMQEYALNAQTMVLAPFWNDKKLATSSPASEISVGFASLGTNQYYLIEFANMNTDDYPASETNRISFQVALPCGGTNFAYVRYGSQTGDAAGEYASVGFQNFGGRPRYSYCYETAGMIYPDLALAFVLGKGTNPILSDTDADGLGDGDEVMNYCSNPLQPDTDGDNLHDGWEAAANFNPCLNNAEDDDPANDSASDPDDDGLSNFEECNWGTNPHAGDSDKTPFMQ